MLSDGMNEFLTNENGRFYFPSYRLYVPTYPDEHNIYHTKRIYKIYFTNTYF